MQNVSETGLFISSSRLPPLGATLTIHVETRSGSCRLRGQVVRHAIVPMELRSVKTQGFAVRFVGARSGLQELLEGEPHGPTMKWATRLDYLTTAHAELERGGLTFPLSSAVAVNQMMELTLECGWRDHPLVVRGRVVHCRAEGPGFVGIMLLEHPEVALAWLDERQAA